MDDDTLTLPTSVDTNTNSLKLTNIDLVQPHQLLSPQQQQQQQKQKLPSNISSTTRVHIINLSSNHNPITKKTTTLKPNTNTNIDKNSPFILPPIINVFGWGFYETIENPHFLRRKRSDYFYFKGRKYKNVAFELLLNQINFTKIIPINYAIPQFKSDINGRNINSNETDRYYKVLKLKNRSLGRKLPYISNLISNYTKRPLLFLPTPKNGLTKIGPLILLLLENIRWNPSRKKKSKNSDAYWIPETDPSNDMYVHFVFDRKLTELKFDYINVLKYANIMRNKEYITFLIVRDPIERLLSAFLDKCIRDRRHWCIPGIKTGTITKYDEYITNVFRDPDNVNGTLIGYMEEKENDYLRLFDIFVYELYQKIVIRQEWAFINEHFSAQCENSLLYHFIDYYNFIIIYNKNDFEKNVYQLLIQFDKDGVLDKENGKDIDYYWNYWGNDKNQTLFKNSKSNLKSMTTHTMSNTYDKEIDLIKKYFQNYTTLEMAFKVYQFDYMVLPFKYPPVWIDNVTAQYFL